MRIVSYFESADPLLNWTRRMRLDAVLLLLFFVVMYDRLTQNPLHEMLGTASLLIVCTHLLVNRTWLRQHFGTWFGMEVKRPRRPKEKVMSAQFPTSCCLRPLPPPSSQV